MPSKCTEKSTRTRRDAERRSMHHKYYAFAKEEYTHKDENSKSKISLLGTAVLGLQCCDCAVAQEGGTNREICR